MEVAPELAEDLLQAADQYMLEGLKRLCEAALSNTLNVSNLMSVYELSENFNAPQLSRRCVLYALDRFSELMEVPQTVPDFEVMSALTRLLGLPVQLYCIEPSILSACWTSRL